MSRTLASLALLPVLAACAAESRVAPSPAESVGIDYEVLMDEAGIPGLAVAVIEGGAIVSIETLGVAGADSGMPVTPTTLFEAASLSKPVFATAVLRLVERGELDLDLPLDRMLEYERVAHDPRAARITARLVLSHRTGLPNWGGETLELVGDPGEWFGYSGEGFVYLQRVVEHLTGLALDEVVRREVFEPLGMTASAFSFPEGETPALAAPHDEAGRQQEKRPAREGNAAASLLTTAEDYARFVVAWMRGDLLREATRAEALTPVTRLAPAPDDGDATDRAAVARVAWGLGWGILLPDDAGDGRPIYWHWGDNGPAKAFVAFEPEAGDGFVFFANSSNGLAIGEVLAREHLGEMELAFTWNGYRSLEAPGFAERLTGVVAEAEGRYADALAAFRAAAAADPDDEALGRRVEWIGDLLAARERPVEVAPEILESYAGAYGPRRLTLEDGTLRYQRDGGAEYRLVPLTESLFALDGLTIFRLEVVRGDDGVPSKLVGHYVNGQSDETPRDGT